MQYTIVEEAAEKQSLEAKDTRSYYTAHGQGEKWEREREREKSVWGWLDRRLHRMQLKAPMRATRHDNVH